MPTIPIGTPIEQLDTPCLLVDLDRLAHNLTTWQSRATQQGVKLRPHIKTHKSPIIGQMQLEAGASGITVAKLGEAEIFAAAGFADIFIAYPLVGDAKWQRAAHLAQVCTLTVGVDSEIGARGLSQAAAQVGSSLRVRVEINLGMDRSGVLPENAEKLCRVVASLPNLDLVGIFTYRSVNFPAAKGRDAVELGLEEAHLMLDLAQRLQTAGLPIHEISLGSTPTGLAAGTVAGITEIRPGTYIFGDYLTAERGMMTYDELALSILCTVVSRPTPHLATVDGGSKTFSGDLNPAAQGLQGYAKAVDREAYVTQLSEEHGVVRLAAGVEAQIGEKMAFYPIHVCTTVNLSDELIGVRGGRVEQIFPIVARGKRQ